jgi:(2Fe-2S) ferredoxin
VRSFECLGACDIGPMASVNGEYVGPLELADAERIVEDLNGGRPVLRDKQLRYRRSVDPNVQDGATEFSAPDDAPRADTAGLTEADRTADRPGPGAPFEIEPQDQSET